MTEENKFKKLLKDQFVAIDGEQYRIDDVVIHRKKESHMVESFTLSFSATDNPEHQTQMTVPYSALFAVLNTLFSLIDITEDFVSEVESFAHEAFKASNKFKEKLSRGLEAFAEEIKKT
jgi:PDZ domain-containing secreted protein